MQQSNETAEQDLGKQMDGKPDLVDEVPPVHRLAVLGFQHVLVMYAGAVAVPLVLGHALELSAHQIGLLISADLFACGLVTLVQTIGFPGVGLRLPIMMGVTFASVGPMLAIAESVMARGSSPSEALQIIYGAVIVAGLFGLLCAPMIGRLSKFFPPIVTGTVILVIGVSLIRIGVGWAGPSPALAPGSHLNLLVSAIVLAIIVLILKFGNGLVRNSAILLGVAAGTILATLGGQADFSPVAEADWVGITPPFAFGIPKFEVGPSISMILVMIIVMVESIGMFFAVSEIVGRTLDSRSLTMGLRADGIGAVIGGIFNTFPYTSFSQNIGLIAVTGVRSRFVCAAGGVIMLILGLSPKMAVSIASLPTYVLGGAGLVMFGMIAATGIRVLSTVDFKTNTNNLTILAISLSLGMIPIVSDDFFAGLPSDLQPLLHSGILLATLSATILNRFFNGKDEAQEAL